VINGATNSVITTITVGSGPRVLVHNLTNNKVYCINGWSDNVTVIDGTTNNVITTITVGSDPWSFAWNPVQNRTYVANYNGSSISVIRDVTGIEEEKFSQVGRDMFTTTLFNGPLQLPTGKTCKVFNISGRVVMPDRIKPGIYFVEIEGEIVEKVIKIR
jgi:YVTN family beta-propeller protein